MAKNLRALTNEELEYIVNNYIFTLQGEYIVVQRKNYGLKTLHPIDKPFSISTKMRRVTISKQAIDLWVTQFKQVYSLIEVQAAINRLTVTFQDLSTVEIAKQLKTSRDEIKLEE